MDDGDLILPGASSGVVSPPQVSLVLINWNYGDFVGAAIESIKGQDYPRFEAIVVDNGSTDESRDVVARHVADDPRFRVLCLDKNLGQLGAFLEVFEEVQGDFVTIVDADDVLLPDFVSSHVQVHLALPFSVGLTSSNVVEMTASGRVVTGSYAPLNRDRTPASRGLRSLGAAVRLSTVSEADYRELTDATRTLVGEGGWIWGPGTSNMFRRSVLSLVHHKPKDRTYFRAADNYLCPFCHVFGGSALIDKPLSAYRIHDVNYYAERESFGDVPKGRVDMRLSSRREILETLDVLFSRAKFFKDVLPGMRFWRAVDQIARPMQRRDRKTIPLSAGGATPFSDNYESLVEAFGEDALLAELRKRLRPNDLRALLRTAHGGRIPRRVRWWLLLENAQSSWGRKAARKPSPKVTQGGQAPPVEDKSMDFGPAAILSFDPPIIYSGIAFEEYAGIAPAFGKRYGDIPAAFLIYPTWTIESEDRSGCVIKAAKAHQENYPSHELVYLCNTAVERDRLLAAGLDAHLLNKNFTVSEKIFRPLPNAQIEFDAVYNARFDPRKRHELARRIPSVAYVSFATGKTGTLRDQRALLAEVIERKRNHVLLNTLKDGLPVPLSPEDVNEGLNRAAVGLCLSRVEGANYASMEYLLAGLPVVSTPSIGGRDVYFDHEVCTICDPNPDSVLEAVQNMKERQIPREYVRERALAKIEPERWRFLSLIDDLSERLGGKRCYGDGVWPFETSSVVALNTYSKHLDAFEKGRGKPLVRSERDPSHADVEKLLAETDGVQLLPEEILPIVRAIKSRPGCAMLVFGCGNDSVLWEEVNKDGTTSFIEDDPVWAESAKDKLKRAKVYLTDYGTRLSEWVSLLNTTHRLDLDLPEEIVSRQWDVIVVDGPLGNPNFQAYTDREPPGRTKSIFAASKLVAPGGVVFVHDCDRLLERQYAKKYLGSEKLFLSVKGRALLQGYAF